MSFEEPKSSRNAVGTRLRRKEDGRLVTGKGKYIGDMVLPGMLHAIFVRSEVAHAIIKSIDTTEARAMPGVMGVFVGEDLKAEINSMTQKLLIPNLPGQYPEYWPLAVGKVKYHGEPVALVVARDKYVAEDAAEAVVVDYEELPVVTDAEKALEPGAVRVHDDVEGNEIFAMTFTGGQTKEEQDANAAEVDKIFESADYVVKERFKVHRTGVTPMEPRGVLCDWNDNDGLTAWITTQRPHIDRLALVDILGVPADKVRVITPRDMGGAFGIKAPFYRENVVIAYAAMKMNRPVRWLESRMEMQMNVGQERDQVNYLEVAASKDGELLAMRNRGFANSGVGCVGVYWGIAMPFLGAINMPNAYTWKAGDVSLRCAITNKTSLTPSRAFGLYPTRFAIERAIDMVSRKIGMEPALVRLKNMIPELPYRTVTGDFYDSGDFVKVWKNLLDHADLDGFRKEQAEARKKGKYLGIGFSCGVELSGVASELMVPMENQPGYGSATIRAEPRGTMHVFTGDAPSGQGHETTIPQAVSMVLGISPDNVAVVTGDTSHTPFGSGSIGARFGAVGVSAVAKACQTLKDKMIRIHAHDQKVDPNPEHFEFADGQITYTPDPSKSISFANLADRIIMSPIDLPEGDDGGLETTAFFESAVPMICFNSDCCVVEVDLETAEWQIRRWVTSEDVGTVINPMVVDGQMHGAIVHGLSNAMFEEYIYDENGQQLSADLESYKMATAADMPDFELTYAPTPSPHTPLGTRGIAEGRPSSVPGALTNAICDALTPFGIEITELPIRPDGLWKKLREAEAKQAAQ